MRDRRLITSAESASILVCTPENVRKLARQGKLPVVTVVGRGTRLFDRDVIRRLADERGVRTPTTDEAA